MTQDLAIKIVLPLLTGLLMALAGWVWSTNLAVERLQVEFDVAQKNIEEMKSNSTDIQLIKQDIQYIKGDIADIKNMLTAAPK